jgi:hypothetical protein
VLERDAGVVAARNPAHVPLVHNGGLEGLTSAQGAAKIREGLALFPVASSAWRSERRRAGRSAAGSTVIAKRYHDKCGRWPRPSSTSTK